MKSMTSDDAKKVQRRDGVEARRRQSIWEKICFKKKSKREDARKEID